MNLIMNCFNVNVHILATGETLLVTIGRRFVSNRERPVKENTTQLSQSPICLLGSTEKSIRNCIFTKNVQMKQAIYSMQW